MTLVLAIHATGIDEQVHSFKGVIYRASGGRRSNYCVELSGARGSKGATGNLVNYPRWSEPLRVFVARSIEAACADFELDVWPTLKALKLDIALNQTHLVSVSVNDLATLQLGRQSVPGESSNPWVIVKRTCLRDELGCETLPGWPDDIHVPRYWTENGYSYCRVGDLPPEVQVAWKRRFYHQTRLAVPGVPDAISAVSLEQTMGDA